MESASGGNDDNNNNNSSSSSSSQQQQQPQQRWTCEACGCHTNQASDRSCTICGTSHSGPSLLRRAGAGYAAAARAGWLARGLAVGGGRGVGASRSVQEELGLEVDDDDDDELWESVVAESAGNSGNLDLNDDGTNGLMVPESAMESLAMEVSSLAHRGSIARRMAAAESRQRFLQAARAITQQSANNAAASAEAFAAAAAAGAVQRAAALHAATSAAAAVASTSSTINTSPTDLLHAATANASEYQPRWMCPSPQGSVAFGGVGVGGSGSSAASARAAANAAKSAIQVVVGSQQNVAHLPPGSGEGFAIRAETNLPRVSPTASVEAAFALSLGSPDLSRRPRRNVFGFRVAFSHPTSTQTGASMGGCYLVGVTTSSFTSFGEPNGLQQTPFFWGIEDSGRKYEGSRRTSASSRSGSRRGPSPFATDVGPREAPFNASNVLFGNEEVVTVVCDLDGRTMTFWRDDTLLGTLVTTLPRGNNLFPVAVPFNRGSTVAITGLDGNPLPLLRAFASECRQAQKEKEEHKRRKLVRERSVLIKHGQMTSRLRTVLTTIFAQYSSRIGGIPDASATSATSIYLHYPEAARLWYRCGFKLASLNTIIKSRNDNAKFVYLADFFAVVERIIDEDERAFTLRSALDQIESSFQVGDKVELVDGYEKFGDAAGGPLQPGERGVVVDLQNGPNGERRSVRVLHNGRRWWYQPQAILSERSGLIESPGVWFLRSLLRSHAYDHLTLNSLEGEYVKVASSFIGDTVRPKSERRTTEHGRPCTCLGRIVSETSSTTGPAASRGRDTGTVMVEFVEKSFADGVGIKGGASTDNSPVLETRRIRASKLVHSNTVFCFPSDDARSGFESAAEVKTEAEETPRGAVSDRLKTEISALARLDRASLEFMIKECQKSSESLAGLFSTGLPSSILAAIDMAERQMNSLETREDLPEKIALIGKLSKIIADQLFCPSTAASNSARCHDESTTDLETEAANPSAPGDNSNPSSNPRRLRLRDVIAGRGGETEDDPSSQNMAILQQRRNMLLSLMSRSRRSGGGGNASFLNELIERENEVFGDITGGSPLLSSIHHAMPFAFGAHSALLQSGSWEEALLGSGVTQANEDQSLPRSGTDASVDEQACFLDSILRCRVDNSEGSSAARSGGSNQLAVIRHMATTGLLTDSLPWVRASIDAHAKKIQVASMQKSNSLLRDLNDEEGTPPLLLAVSLGCSPDVLSFLITKGAVVSKEEILKAAATDQAATLSLLLQHGPLPDDVCISQFSTSIQTVFARAKARQEELDKKMRDEAGAFMVRLLRRLLNFCLVSRRRCSSRVELCSKAISEILVGNVLLRSLQKMQKTGASPANEETTQDDDNADRARRVGVDESLELGISAEGLLVSLPRKVLFDGILSAECLTTFLTLIEDHLCSKDMNDSAAGLALLSLLLTKFPELRSCSELQRYGLTEFVSFHDTLASDRMSNIMSKKSKPHATPVSTSQATSTGSKKDKSSNIVVCPNKHTAAIHITRHSSFRCDICGNGVERGRPMHGCRECDWDACENCTDKSVSGLVKCTAIKEMASSCLELLREPVESEEEDEQFVSVLDTLAQNDTTQELKVLSIRLLKRDLSAFNDLSLLLLKPGCITIHQFIEIVLPTLHAAFVGRNQSGNDGLVAGHRCKKARVVGVGKDTTVYSHSPEDRLNFCKEAIRLIVSGDRKKSGSGSEDSDEMQSDDDSECGQENATEVKETEIGGGSEHVKYSDAAQELVRRLHQVLAFHERVNILTSVSEDPNSRKAGDLHGLTTPLEVKLFPSAFNGSHSSTAQDTPLCVMAEPLIPIQDLQFHILRSCNTFDQAYSDYSKRLVEDKTIVAERALNDNDDTWRIGQIVSFNERSGAHTIQYACGLRSRKGQRSLQVANHDGHNFDDLVFEKCDETHLVLAARQYLILHRSVHSSEVAESSMECESSGRQGNGDSINDLRNHVGARVESNCGPDGSWKVYTLICLSSDDGCILVSDEGLVVPRVKPGQIRVPRKRPTSQSTNRSDSMRVADWARDERVALSRAFPFLSTRNRETDPPSPAGQHQEGHTLKRTWSASALADKTKPMNLSFEDDDNSVDTVSAIESNGTVQLKVQVGDSKLDFVCDSARIESPPQLSVRLCLHDKLPGIDFGPDSDITLVAALKKLHQVHEKNGSFPADRLVKLYFSIETQISSILDVKRVSIAKKSFELDDNTYVEAESRIRFASYKNVENRSRKLSSRSLLAEDEDSSLGICDGLNSISVQCMEVTSLLAEFSIQSPLQVDRDVVVESLFSNACLSKKLSEQLDDPLIVVGQALPEWCTIAPSFAPRVFSYESRRMLLERNGFGVSRSMLKQQEAKVNVGRLRQRMASLRARAVELVGEAFSGGAEDPTALQLQADELYGMEEALAARVRAAFRAVKWQEHVLQVAKAVVRRESLLRDAAAVMEHYANDPNVCRRRLEVRFQGESGFDAASGNEAGVTRGFYADVAESFLSSESVAGVYCSSKCGYVPSVATLSKVYPMDVDGMQQETPKLPLWIPDMDASGTVVIPTPRADERSAPGVFPRPLPRYHPQMPDVLQRFRFIGRLFAAAMRDGFMFPLPLSSAFLKLVQDGHEMKSPANAKTASLDTVLSSADLPRPGFLGGEVFAAEQYICKALDSIDAVQPPLSQLELERRYKEVATDRKFTRIALGKLFDYSFEDYFQDKTFVDPLDPGQGDDAVRLCPDGHHRHVTIYNVREWVALTKKFILHDGVISQAIAFRQGVEDFFPADFLRLFTSDELQRDVCGVGDSVDSWDENAVRKLFKLDGGKGAAEALVAVAAIGGEGGAALSRRFAPSSPTIGFLVKALIEATPTQRRQFLSFVTSVPIVTPGRIEVVPMVSPSGEFLPMHDPGCLPRANTCARKLYLPKFETYDSFSEVLWAVVREESKFKGFFEWRGS